MKSSVLTLIAATSVATASIAYGVEDNAASATIAGRQAAFRLSGSVLGSMKGAIDRGDDVATQAGAARSLAQWGQALPGMFAVGSMSTTSEALPSIWSDRAGFEKAAAAYADAATKLASLAKAGDKAGFATQFGVLRQTCGACHDHYRKAEDHH